ncbi:MAG: hypothetical protein R3F24_09785 [Gammaproteobacteria bacterium]
MRGLFRFIAASRAARAVAIVLTFLVPLTNVLSAAILIIAARAGWRSVLMDFSICLVMLGVLLQVTGSMAPGTALVSAVGLWGGAAAGGLLLLRYRSVNLVVQSFVIAALLGVLAASLIIPDARGYWLPVLEALIKSAGLPQAEGLPADWLATLATLMHGVIAASLLSTLVVALMLALWMSRGPEAARASGTGGPGPWSGQSADPGPRPSESWRRQFLELKMGRVLAALGLVAALAMLAGAASFGGSAVLVLATGFVAQGLSIVHWTADNWQWPRIWPLALYGFLFLGRLLAGLCCWPWHLPGWSTM